MLLIAVFVVVLIPIIFKIYSRLSLGRCTSPVCLVGKTALITGGNSGIGYQTALALASRGCRVIIADKDDCEKSKQQIIKETRNGNIVVKYFNLASLASVRKLAKDINDTEERLDILINNAGTSGLGNSYTDDGLHIGMQVNHFGSFLLTHLLIELLKKSTPSRIIFMSSIAAFLSSVSPKDLNSPTRELMVYSNSKLCNLITANEFAKKLKGTGITVNSLHPGVVYTQIYEKYAYGCGKEDWFKVVIDIGCRLFLYPFSKTPEEGAQTTIHLAVAKEIENTTGIYFFDCKPFLQPPLARNSVYSKKIWEVSENLVKLSSEERL